MVERWVCWVFGSELEFGEVAGCFVSLLEEFGELGMVVEAWRKKATSLRKWVFTVIWLGFSGNSMLPTAGRDEKELVLF